MNKLKLTVLLSIVLAVQLLFGGARGPLGEIKTSVVSRDSTSLHYAAGDADTRALIDNANALTFDLAVNDSNYAGEAIARETGMDPATCTVIVNVTKLSLSAAAPLLTAPGYSKGASGTPRIQRVLQQQAGGNASSILTHIPSSGRKFNQMASRGWGRQGIHNVVNSPHATRPAVNRDTGNPATAFIRQDGHYVVRDDVTGNLVQMSDTRIPIGTGPGQWFPDQSIQNPYIP